ncbi:hypothetical protein K1719_014469 [Acacia pycnantha]|nr:hypothetical protein K1719_014469 [Acacia pycnantha]
MYKRTKVFVFFVFLLLVPPALVVSECTCDDKEKEFGDKAKALRYKIAAIASILFASVIGVLIPVIGKFVPALSPDRDFFFFIKAFAAGVILSTGFIHVLPEAFEKLTSPRLCEHRWAKFPFTGFVAMCTAIGTLMVDAFATTYFKKIHMISSQIEARGGEEEHIGHEGHVHLHTHATHGHVHGSSDSFASSQLLLRHRVISQVLEVGIIVHSVIIGISLGASQDPDHIKPLVAALTFHQFFEGMGLGSCITQAKFRNNAMAIMGLFFALTTPVGIGIGMAITSQYEENAADFMNDRMQNSSRLLLGANISLLLGAGLMSLLAIWA